jgi:hypothetical protein
MLKIGMNCSHSGLLSTSIFYKKKLHALDGILNMPVKFLFYMGALNIVINYSPNTIPEVKWRYLPICFSPHHLDLPNLPKPRRLYPHWNPPISARPLPLPLDLGVSSINRVSKGKLSGSR